MEYLNSYSYHLMDTILESVNESNVNQLETSLEKSDDKLGWYKRLLTKMKNMNTTIKHKILLIVIPLLMGTGISQGSVISTTSDLDNSISVEQYIDMDMDMGSETTTSGLQTYFDTTQVKLRANSIDDTFEKVVEHDNTEIYFKLYEVSGNTGTVVVTLNGKEIFRDNNGLILTSKSHFDSTITANKGDIFKVIDITTSGPNGRVYLDIKMSTDLTIGIEKLSKEDFKIYPNPVESTLNIDYSQDLDLTYEVYSMNGKLVLPTNRLTNSINVSSLTKGYYILKLISEDGVVSKRFMKK